MKLFHRLWTDEAGFVISAELVLVATLLVIGMIVGLTELRNQVVQELADLGQAIGQLSQGYTFNGVTKSDVGSTDGSAYTDVIDFCQDASHTTPTHGTNISFAYGPAAPYAKGEQ